jgi:4-oxalocrotonate tautomerase
MGAIGNALSAAKTAERTMSESYQDIVAMLNKYFEGFYNSDVRTLREVFHPNCHLYTAGDGSLADDDMETVYARVAKRLEDGEGPSNNNAPRYDRIMTIDMSGPECAFAKVRIAIAPRYFTDYLTLIKLDGDWRIITKTYTWVPLAEEAAREVLDAAE